MNQLTFTTWIDADGSPVLYFVRGSLMHEGEDVHVAYTSPNFDRAFGEVCHWVRAVPSLHVEFTTDTE